LKSIIPDIRKASLEEKSAFREAVGEDTWKFVVSEWEKGDNVKTTIPTTIPEKPVINSLFENPRAWIKDIGENISPGIIQKAKKRAEEAKKKANQLYEAERRRESLYEFPASKPTEIPKEKRPFWVNPR